MSTSTATAHTAPSTSERRLRGRVARLVASVLAVVGALAISAGVAGFVSDGLQFDRTSGGTEAPYTDWTGTPVDWSAADVTDTGFRQPGRIVSFAANCTTGMVSFEAFGFTYDWQQFSPRALVVHRPREACVAAGFTPQF